MQESISAIDAALDSPEANIAADQQFHALLAHATQNPLFPLLLDALTDTLQETRRQMWRVPGSPQRGQRCHRQIFEAVAARDPGAARRAMLRHMAQVRRDCARAIKLVEAPLQPAGAWPDAAGGAPEDTITASGEAD